MEKIYNTKTITIRGEGTFTLESYFECVQDNNNIANNTSPVFAKATLFKGTGSFSYSSSQGTLGIYWHDDKSGKDTLWKEISVSKLTSGKVDVSLTKDVSHKDDGSLKGYAVAKWTRVKNSKVVPESGSVATDELEFGIIARASQPSLNVSQATLGSTSVTINTNKKSNFTHTLSYTIASFNEVEIATGVVDSKVWIPPLSIANNFPNNTEGTLVIKCKTYNGTTLIGTKEINLKVLVPSSVVPSISTITLSEANSVMISKAWGVYVQGKSQLKVKTTASGSYSSTIKSYKITGIDSDTFSNVEFTSNVLKTAGTKTITVVVTDSRGRTATKTVSYTCVSYDNPKIEVADVQRCTSTGVISNDGTYLMYSFKASISPANNKNNIQKYEIGYKSKTANSYTYKTIASSGYSLNQENIVLSGVTFANTTEYDIVFRVTDAFGIPNTISKTLGTVPDLMNFNTSGKSMAFGKASEATETETKLEIALDTYFSKSVNIGSKTLQKFIEDILLESDKKKYPVGTILMSSTNTNPASYLKFGTWVAWGSGRVPVGVDTGQTEFNTVEKTGGSKFTEKHSHNVKGDYEYVFNINKVGERDWWGSYQASNAKWAPTMLNGTSASWSKLVAQEFGQGTAGNLQPYITCYMWKRTT